MERDCRVVAKTSWRREDLPPYSLATHGITQAAYTSAGRKRRAHHARRPSRAVSRLPKVTKARSETPKSAKESQISSAATGTNRALVTIAAITTICGRERNTRRMRG